MTIEEEINISPEHDAVSWQTQSNVEYLALYFKGLDSMEILESVKHMKTIMSTRPDNSIRFYLDTTDADLSFSTIMMLSKFSSSVQSKIYRSAFAGVKGQLIPFFKLYKSFTNTKAELFDTKQEALDYICGN